MKLLIFTAFAGASLLALSYRSYEPSQTLDTHMSPDQAQQTGVDQLSPEQRKALQEWINKHHYVKPNTVANKTSNPSVSEVLASGKYLKLSDGTLWKIHPSDIPISSSWITPADVHVEKTGSGAYPYTLTNQLTGSSVRAGSIQSLPAVLEKPPQDIPKQSPKATKKGDKRLQKYFDSNSKNKQ